MFKKNREVPWHFTRLVEGWTVFKRVRILPQRSQNDGCGKDIQGTRTTSLYPFRACGKLPPQEENLSAFYGMASQTPAHDTR